MLLSRPARRDRTLAAKSPLKLFDRLSCNVLKESGPRFLSSVNSDWLIDVYFDMDKSFFF